MTDSPRRCTRLAPSPTGALHLGNARTFLVNWALARGLGWRVVLRIDDLDGPRVKESAARQAIEDLRWLGLDWDEGPLRQSELGDDYASALTRLAEAGRIYPCRCTRSEIEAAQSAPNEGDHELRYPGRCRPRNREQQQKRSLLAATNSWLQPSAFAWRLETPPAATSFVDRVLGESLCDVQRQVGDFVVCVKSGWPSYQLAVVIDDARQRVTDVVRGDDLLDSTHRQLHVASCLQLPSPEYWHLPIVVGEDGRRLAKRHGDSRLRTYRDAGVGAERVIGLLAEWSGLGERRAMSAVEFRDRFAMDSLPRERAVMRAADHAWLLDHSS